MRKGRVGRHPFPELAGDLLEVPLDVVGDGIELFARVVEELLCVCHFGGVGSSVVNDDGQAVVKVTIRTY